MHFIGIDIGTSSVCAAVYNPDTEKVESVTVANDSALDSEEIWEKRQDPAHILQIVRQILDELCSRYDVKAIGFTGQMHGMLYVDAEGNAVSPLYTWQDGRGNQIYRDGKTYAAVLTEKTGYPVASGYGLVTHYYNTLNGLVPTGSAKICTIMDYVAMKLASEKTPVSDYSNGAGFGLFDLENLQFDTNALKKAGIDISILPELSESTTCCGFYKRSIALYTAIGDNQAAFLGSVTDIHRSLHITVGTSSQVSVYSEKFVTAPSLDTRPFPGGGYILVGAALCGGEAFLLLKDFFEKTLELFGAMLPDEAELYRIMTSVPHVSDSREMPIVRTLFDGTRTSPGQRGSIENISLKNFTPENLILGFLKGIVHELSVFFQHVPEEIRDDKQVMVGSGNALKKNPLLQRVFEDQFNSKMIFSAHPEEAAFGACLNALTGSQRAYDRTGRITESEESKKME